MLLAIDIGNTRAKAAVFADGALLKPYFFDQADAAQWLPRIFSFHPEIENVIVASVAGDITAGIPHDVRVHEITRGWRFPFQNNYETPETLGIDRMILASGATLFYPSSNRIVIDAGTCITYDLINDQDEYLGGAISPGIDMRYRALNEFTAKLPRLTASDPEGNVGTSTANSIHHGVVDGVLDELHGFIERHEKQRGNFIIILTGGDAEFLAGRTKRSIFASSNFLLESMNRLYQYNHG